MYVKWRGFCGTITLAASLATLGCGNTPISYIRAVNASPGSASIAFQVGQTPFAGLTYGGEGAAPKGKYVTVVGTGIYRMVPAGVSQPIVTYITHGSTLATGKQTLLPKAAYTVVSLGAAPGIELRVLADNGTAPPSGQYNLRFLDTAASTGAIDVYVTAPGALPSGSPIIGNLSFNNPAPYTPEVPGTLELQITGQGSTQVLATAAFSPAAGSLYSVFFLDPGNGAPYKLLIVPDAVAGSIPAI